ncbi:hypothetical protein F2Q70_00012220 [Brassica cretica]|uniref:Uncharacterized protein n=1 Tax=Brassica cretica TaxID=69181 RepID=A0A3N6PU80_BRACR|nr:hypothetical protein F2Q70_00012220 [Brassica cretica]KAF3545413.1 hypothetical protein DY000_02008164 [Brassica cretica]
MRRIHRRYEPSPFMEFHEVRASDGKRTGLDTLVVHAVNDECSPLVYSDLGGEQRKVAESNGAYSAERNGGSSRERRRK